MYVTPPCTLPPHVRINPMYVITGSGDSGFQCSSISLPAPPPLPRPRYFDNNLAKMDRTVLEIVDTEAVYVRDLGQVIEVSVRVRIVGVHGCVGVVSGFGKFWREIFCLFFLARINFYLKKKKIYF